MTRDYARKPGKRKANRRQTAKPQGAPGWVWLLAGAMLGAVVTGLVKLSDVPDQQHTAEPEPNNQTAPSSEPNFIFYSLLKESEVIVPENEAPTTATQQPSSKPNAIFLLQVGSFKSATDADSLRARLLLLNLQATVEKVNPRPGETWHRVIVGPFDSNKAVSSARNKLATNQIDSLLLKRTQ